MIFTPAKEGFINKKAYACRLCGHPEWISMNVDLDTLNRRLAREDCYDCFKKKELEAAIKYEYKNALPCLNGTLKQCLFASSMRYRILVSKQINFTAYETKASWWIDQAYKCGAIKKRRK